MRGPAGPAPAPPPENNGARTVLKNVVAWRTKPHRHAVTRGLRSEMMDCGVGSESAAPNPAPKLAGCRSGMVMTRAAPVPADDSPRTSAGPELPDESGRLETSAATPVFGASWSGGVVPCVSRTAGSLPVGCTGPVGATGAVSTKPSSAPALGPPPDSSSSSAGSESNVEDSGSSSPSPEVWAPPELS